MQFVTYAHYKPDGTMFYVGKGSISRAYSAAGRNVVWKRTVEKYGGYKVQILAKWETEQDAFDHEIVLIESLKAIGVPLVNIAAGGLGSKGFRHTEEHKINLSKRMATNNPMHDMSVRDKHRKVLLEAMLRPEVRQKQSKVRIGMKFSQSHIESLRKCHPTKPCVINGVTYDSLMEASRKLGIRHGTLHRWLNRPEIKRGEKYGHITECRWA